MFDKQYDFNDITIGYHDTTIGDCEILFSLFKPDDDLSPVCFNNIEYYRTDTKILWNKKSRIDVLFHSGDTKSKLKHNPNRIDISYSNYSHLPAFVKKLVYFDKINKQLTDVLLGLELQLTSLSVQQDVSLELKLEDSDTLHDFTMNIEPESATAEHKVDSGTRYTHFFSIRIHNPLITTLATLLQEDIADGYRRQGLDVSTSFIRAFKFHITMNVLRLPTDHHVQKVVKLAKLLQRWLKTFIFAPNDGAKKFLIGDDGIFMNCINKYKYYDELKGIYDKIKDNESLLLYLEGANHFNQSVIFLDFENQSVVPTKEGVAKGNRNGWILKYVETIYDLISDLCYAYKLNVNSALFVPHCTIMKLSKLKRHQMNKLIKHNRRNRITLQTGHNYLGNNDKIRHRRQNKVYDFDILTAALSNENIDRKIESIQTEDMHETALSEDIINIDFCAMLGSHLTEDGYYQIIQSLSIVP